ncbi:MAG TPA: VOC family protein [Clostridia bacterium]|nr:VOC family protein [Clostridia bacterium]
MTIVKRTALLLIASLIASFAIGAYAADNQVNRPKIIGVAHIAIYVSDLQKARAFYKDFLGYEEPYAIKRDDGTDRIAVIKINEDQYIELFADPPKQDGQLNHVSILTDSAEQMRLYLDSKGINVPEKVGKGRIGNSNFNIVDPDGHTLEIVQYEPASWTRRETGKHIPPTRISTHMPHLGFTVRDLNVSLKFYGDVLDFREVWRGSPSPQVLSWVHMQVPDGKEFFELMLYSRPLTSEQLGGKNHLCLIVPDIQNAVADLNARPARKGYTRPIEIRTGVNGKRQANLFDPDGTRVELMEADTVDGKVVAPSKAPAPRFDPGATPVATSATRPSTVANIHRHSTGSIAMMFLDRLAEFRMYWNNGSETNVPRSSL